jgi:uncharacterized membrane protein HdeD (DUF308 family)
MPRKMKMDDAKMQEHWKMHKKMMGCKMLVLGALVLANTYWSVVNWANFIGIVLVVAGILKLVKPCNCK